MFNIATSPIRTIADIRAVNDAAISSTGYFDAGYLESRGEQIIGSPVIMNDDMGRVIVRKPGGSYGVTFYQRTHYMNGVGLHNYTEGNRTFKHISSARRFARTF